ncbi:MAG: glutathione S-transferase family protein [Rhodoferax sp.]|jgi:GST-like protein|nr:glutathione S-transferase family protein [Rhodoferax sp.]
MIKFYYNTAPNPAKVALFLEESGLPYEIVPVDTRKGEQHAPAYTAINPNAKVPSIDDDGVIVFDSNAILLYLAEKCGRFLPPDTPQARGEMLSWLMFIASGIGPYSGQAVHFRRYAPEPIPYAIQRYDFEAWRHWNIINDRLGRQPYMVGDQYTLVDMALWGWARVAHMVLGDEAQAKLPHVKRLVDEINARPAAQRVEALKSRHTFKTEFDAQARKAFFPHMQEAAR